MGKSHRQKKNTRVRDSFGDYLQNLDSDKLVESQFVVSDVKRNHPTSHFGEMAVVCSYPLGCTSVSCEIRNLSPHNYSFTYASDWVSDRLLARLDVGDGTHYNRVPGVPLEESSVPTPHIHLYREDGYLIAHRLDGIDYSSEQSVEFNYHDGYSYLCRCLHIKSDNSQEPSFDFIPEGRLNFQESDADPNGGIEFPMNNIGD